MHDGIKILHPADKYVMPGPDQVRFITQGQTLSLILGSCISTVFIGRNSEYIVSANHIMIAREHPHGIIAKKSALRQIDEILEHYRDDFAVDLKDIRCLHLVGAGKKMAGETFHVHSENIDETRSVLSSKKIDIFFDDTRSHYFATFSLDRSHMSVFVEDKLAGVHLSYILDLDKLFDFDPGKSRNLPASALKPGNLGFEEFVEKGVIVFITGEKNRRYD
jgi:chemotaxis receptor (MCP) glutamine deamidase CheD